MKRFSRFRPVAYVLLFLVFAGIFFIITFPGESITRTINAGLKNAYGDLASIDSARFSPPTSIKVDGIRVRVDGDDLEIGRARISPSILSMLSSMKRWKIDLAGAWGKIPLKIGMGDGRWEMSAKGADIDVSKLLLDDLPVEMAGRIILNSELVIVGKESMNISGKGNMALDKVVLSGGPMEMFGIDHLEFDKGKAFWSIRENVVTIGENGVEGDIIGNVRGTIQLDPDNLVRSRLNMILNLRPSPKAADKLSLLFSLAGGKKNPDGSVNVKIRGTLGDPKYSL